MKVYTIETGNFMLDGGTMFGVVPKVMWEKLYPCNENNLVNLSMRSLLIEEEDRILLIDTGLGEELDEKFASQYFPNGDVSLVQSLAKAGFKPEDITDVIITHLHFDHCGGNTVKKEGQFVPAFPNARYYISHDQWNAATNPNRKEKASFCEDHFLPLERANQLTLVNKPFSLTSNVFLNLFYGHTRGQIIPRININTQTIVYVADLIPVMAHIPLPYICAYDIEPLTTLQEKEQFLQEAYKNKYILFFEHDLYNECCTLYDTKKGIRADKSFRLSDIFPLQ